MPIEVARKYENEEKRYGLLSRRDAAAVAGDGNEALRKCYARRNLVVVRWC